MTLKMRIVAHEMTYEAIALDRFGLATGVCVHRLTPKWARFALRRKVARVARRQAVDDRRMAERKARADTIERGE